MAPVDQAPRRRAPADHHGEGATRADGLHVLVTMNDHKRIGILDLWTVAAFFVLGGVEALLIRVQLGAPENMLLMPERYNQLFTMHGTTMVFLVVVPVWAGWRTICCR